mgnify:CR=1 FL=1
MLDICEDILKRLEANNQKIVTAESCTGGLIAAALTDIPGSSSVFERGFITYSNDAKVECLNVSRETLREHGAVSAEIAREMALGALKNSQADIAISITGVAGPSGGSTEKPVGTVYIGLATSKGAQSHRKYFDGTRTAIREKSMREAFEIVLAEIRK